MTYPTSRLHYFHGQFLVEKDFTDESKYHIDQRELQSRTSHVRGVLEGLSVALKAGDPKTLVVSSGVAVDGLGRQILLDVAREVQPPGVSEDTLYSILIKFKEELTAEAPPNYPSGHTRTTQKPDISFETAAGPADVVLGEVTVQSGGTMQGLTKVNRRYAGTRLPGPGGKGFDVRSVPAGEEDGKLSIERYTPNDASFQPLVTVTEAGQVGIGTAAPGAALEVNGQVKITGGAPGDGKVLVSDTGGTGTWQQLASAALADGSVTTEKLGVSAVTSSRLAPLAVTTDKIVPLAVTNERLAFESVTSEKIAFGAVTSEKIAFESVTSEKIAFGAVTNDKLDFGAVTNDKIAPQTITGDRIAFASVHGEKIAPQTITGDRIAFGSVPGDRLAFESVTGERIAFGAVTNDKLDFGAVTNDKIAFHAVTPEKIMGGTPGQILTTLSAGGVGWVDKTHSLFLTAASFLPASFSGPVSVGATGIEKATYLKFPGGDYTSVATFLAAEHHPGGDWTLTFFYSMSLAGQSASLSITFGMVPPNTLQYETPWGTSASLSPNNNTGALMIQDVTVNTPSSGLLELYIGRNGFGQTAELRIYGIRIKRPLF